MRCHASEKANFPWLIRLAHSREKCLTNHWWLFVYFSSWLYLGSGEGASCTLFTNFILFNNFILKKVVHPCKEYKTNLGPLFPLRNSVSQKGSGIRFDVMSGELSVAKQDSWVWRSVCVFMLGESWRRCQSQAKTLMSPYCPLLAISSTATVDVCKGLTIVSQHSLS